MDIRAKWQGLAIVPTSSASNEMFKYEMTINDVQRILEEGCDCCRGRRKECFRERCMAWGDKTIKVVVARVRGRFDGRDEWAIVHVGLFDGRKR